LVPVRVWKQCRSKVEARRRTAPPPAGATEGAEAAAPAEPFSLPPPPAALLLPLPTGDTCAEMACSECQIEAARRVSLRSSEASVGTNSCFFFSPEGRGRGREV